MFRTQVRARLGWEGTERWFAAGSARRILFTDQDARFDASRGNPTSTLSPIELNFRFLNFRFLVLQMSLSSSLALTGAVLTFLGLVFAVVGFATPWWVSYEHGVKGDADYRRTYYGLWAVRSMGGVQGRGSGVQGRGSGVQGRGSGVQAGRYGTGVGQGGLGGTEQGRGSQVQTGRYMYGTGQGSWVQTGRYGTGAGQRGGLWAVRRGESNGDLRGSTCAIHTGGGGLGRNFIAREWRSRSPKSVGLITGATDLAST